MIKEGDLVKVQDQANWYFGRIGTVKAISKLGGGHVATVKIRSGKAAEITFACRLDQLEKQRIGA